MDKNIHNIVQFAMLQSQMQASWLPTAQRG